MAKHREKEFAFKYWDMPWAQIMCLWAKDNGYPRNDKQLALYCNVSEDTLAVWKREKLHLDEEADQKADGKQTQFGTEDILEGIDPAKMSDDELLAHIIRSLFGGLSDDKRSNSAAETLSRIKGFLVIKKPEDTQKLDGEQIASAIKRADRELREGGYRISEEPSERPLLPARTRIHTEQEHGSDS